MRKSDLKTGMIIETRAGKRGIIMLGTTKGDIIAGCGGYDHEGKETTWKPMRDILDDLTYSSRYFHGSDIVAVYDPGSNMEYGSLIGSRIWKREEPPIEMSIKEIAEKLGIDPDRLKIIEKK